MRAISILTLLLLLPAEAGATPSPERKLTVLLSARHGLPSRAVLEREVPEVKAALMSMAEREELFPFYRQRAVDALTMWPDEDVRALYVRLLASESTSVLVKQRVLLRTPKLFGPAAAEILRPYADGPEPTLRRAARISLRKQTLVTTP